METNHGEALKRFKLSAQAETEQRKRNSAAIRFADGEQWPEEVLAQRRSQNSAVGPIGARPCLVINNLRQPLQQQENQMRSARLAPDISPKSGAANRATAEMLQGLYRNIEVQSRAAIARNWAYQRALKCGLGYYRILKEYSNDGDFDQDITIRRILNQASVYLDPFAVEPDWSDGMWAFVTVDYPTDRYRREFPKSRMAGMSNDELTAVGDTQPSWVQSSDGEPLIRVAEYWRVEIEKRQLVVTSQGWRGFTDAEDFPKGAAVIQSRDVEARTVKFAKMNAVETLEESDWDGRYIPIIPVIGNEDNIDGKRLWEGIVRPAMDSCRVYNYQVSKMVEATGLAPLAPYIVAEGQIEGYEHLWNKANNVPYSTLPYKPVSLLGQNVPPPQRNFGEPPIQAIAQSIHQSKADIQATTGYTDPSLGLPERDQSGRAIMALQRQTETGNSQYLDNLATISMTYEAKVILDLIPHVYDTPGRVVQILGIGDEQSTVMLNQPFKPGPDSKPMPAVPNDPQAILHDLKGKAEYGVVVNIGKQYSTQRQEGAATIGELLPHLPPPMAAAITPLYIENLDIPEAQAMADLARQALPPELQKKDPNAPQQQIPPQIQQQMQGMQQQMQQMGQALQEAQSGMAVEQMKIESQERIKAAELQSTQSIEAAKLQTQKELALLKMQNDRETTQTKHGIDAATQMAKIQHDQEQAAFDAQHQADMAAQSAMNQQAASEQQAQNQTPQEMA